MSANPPSPTPEESSRERRSFREKSFHGCMLLFALGAALALVPLWAPLLLASWMAIVIRPMHVWLANKVGGRNRAAGVVTVLLVVVALTPVVVIGLSLAAAAVGLAERLQKTGGAQEALQTLLTAEPSLSGGGLNAQKAMDFVKSHGGGALNAVSMIFGAATAATIGLFVFVYGFFTCLVDGRSGYAWLLDHSPLERRHTERLAAAFEETGRGLLIGVGLTALIQGGIATVGYVIIGVPQALVLGLVTMFAALIPSIGTGLVWAPVTLGLLLAGETGKAVAVLGLGCAISVADNFVRPVLSRHAHLDLHTFVLFVAMLGGIGIFGAWGLLAGPLFVRMTVEALRLGRERHELGGEGVDLFESPAAQTSGQQVILAPGE